MLEQTKAFQPDWVSPPGETILDLLEERDWTRSELAVCLGFKETHVTRMVAGELAVTEDTALRLERVLGDTADFWLARERRYRQRVEGGA